MQWSMAPSLGSGNTGVIAQMYKTMVGNKRLSSYTTDFNSTGTATTSYAVMIARNFTVNAGHTITMGGTANYPSIIICDTLTVNGTLTAGTYGNGGASNNGSGAGGAGGRALYIFARQIFGSGTISSNGQAGGNGSSSTYSSNYGNGTNGGGAYLPFSNAAAPVGGVASATPSTATGGVLAIGSSGAGTINEMMLRFPTWFMSGYNVFNGTSYNWTSANNFGGTGASGASGNYSTSAYAFPGGGGGGSAIASGGVGGYAGTTTASATGGGGGGGGGTIYIFTETVFPSITLQAMGGVGGNPYGTAGAGGGGAGGYIGLWCPTSSATTVVTGGAAGTGGSAATAGSAGSVDQLVFTP